MHTVAGAWGWQCSGCSQCCCHLCHERACLLPSQGVLGTPGEFRRRFEGPILAAREPGASPEEVSLGQERSAQLSALVNVFILRRTNTLLSAHLPPKVRCNYLPHGCMYLSQAVQPPQLCPLWDMEAMAGSH
jgi:hypothetical protein